MECGIRNITRDESYWIQHTVRSKGALVAKRVPLFAMTSKEADYYRTRVIRVAFRWRLYSREYIKRDKRSNYVKLNA